MTISKAGAQPALAESAAEQDRMRRIGRKVRHRLAGNPAAQSIASERAELWAVAGFFDEFECSRLIQMIDAVARPSQVYAAAGDVDTRTSWSGDMDPRDPFVRKLEQRFDELLGIDHRNGETVEGQRYQAGQQFKTHTDWFPYNSPGWQSEKVCGGQRTFTAMVYLNSVEEGGETDFPLLDLAIHPRAGTLVTWNNIDPAGVPNPATTHAGNPVIRGTKYVVTKWYRSHRWRPLPL